MGSRYRRFCDLEETYDVQCIVADEKPDVAYADIGGMDIQKQEVKEAVELPLTHFELYKQVSHADRFSFTRFS